MVLVASGPPRGERGKYAPARKMTPEVLLEICKERNMWTLPHLNNQLYLNYKGFERIEGLESYVAVRTLHLGNNSIARIEGLERMSELRSLHLEGNRITCIENLHCNLDLRQLNLENNGIKSAAGLAHLTRLEQLNLAHNCIGRLEDLEDVRALEKLSNIDVSHNQIEAADGVVEFWAGMSASVRLLRYHANPGVRSIEHYRKRLVNALPKLTYLDERPVYPVERRSSAAWAEGGAEAMHQAKRDFVAERMKAQAFVDPERGEILTRMRKAAIARIEREAREREEQEEEKRRSGAPDCGDVGLGGGLVSGDEGALAAYARKWQTKVDLHGAEGVRAQVAREDGAGGALPGSVAARPETSARPAHNHFAPPPRTDPAEAQHRELGIVGACGGDAPSGGASLHSARGGRTRPACASEFRVSQACCAGGDERERLQDRQFAVLGEDPWAGTGLATAAAAPRGGRGPSGGPGGGGAAAAPEVMPAIWERSQELNRAAEAQCLERNLAAARAAPSAAEELGSLD